MSSSETVHPWDPPGFDDARLAAAVEVVGDAGTLTPWSLPAFEASNGSAVAVAPSPLETAWQRGYDQGVNEGRTRESDRIEPAIAALEGAVGRFRASEARFASERERFVTGLSLAVARQLVQQDLAAEPEKLRALIGKALDLAPAESALEVRMHPADLEALAPAIEALAVRGAVPALAWVGDGTLERGDFVIEGPSRIVDGRTDVALRQLFERLERD